MQDFRYSPMKASLRSRSLESTRSIIQDKDSVPDFPLNTGQTNGTTPSRQLHTSQPQSSVTGHRPHNGFSVIQATGSPSGLSAVTRQLSASSRHTIMPSSTLASNAAQHDKALSSPSRRSSFDSTHSNSHSPARHPLIPSTERPSSMWSQLASPPTAPAASAPQVNRSPTRAAYRTAQLMARQHSMRSSVSSLPDIDEDNNSFTSTRTDESIVAPNTHHSPHQTPPSSAKQAQHLAPPGHLQHLHSVGQLQASQNSSRQTNLLVSRRLLPEFHEQPNASGPSSAAVQTAQTAGPQTDQTAALQRVQHAGTQTDQNAQQASGNTAADTALQTQPSKELAAAQANRFTVSEVVSAVDDSPQQPQVLGIAAEPAHPGTASINNWPHRFCYIMMHCCQHVTLLQRAAPCYITVRISMMFSI